MHKAIYLDKNGTIVNDPDPGYVHKIKDFKLLPGVVQGLKKLSSNFIFIVITNQSGISRGIHSEGDMHKFDNVLISKLKKEGIEIKKIYYCPHTPEDLCKCRKPHTKYIKEAEKEFNIDIKNSWVIGDHPHDAEMGIKNGCKSVYLLTGHGSKHIKDLESRNINPTFVANDFLEAAEFIMSHAKKQSKRQTLNR